METSTTIQRLELTPTFVHPKKKLCAWVKDGRHYFISDEGYNKAFCSKECQRKDDRDTPR
jgi:hypothetical protein